MSGEWWGRRMADRRAACPSSLLTCSSHWKEGTGCLPKSSEKRTGHLIMWGARNKLKIGLVFENNISVSFAMQQLIFIKKKVLEFCPGFQNHGGGNSRSIFLCILHNDGAAHMCILHSLWISYLMEGTVAILWNIHSYKRIFICVHVK